MYLRDTEAEATVHAILKTTGFSEADILHMQTVGALSTAGFEQYVDESHRETEQHFQRSSRALARRILRREIAEVDQQHATAPPSEAE
jgi:hypothetical protein